MRSNSIRLRLTRSEVDGLARNGLVSETISFGPEPYQKLVYSVVGRDVQQPEFEYFPGSLEVVLPEDGIAAWASSDQVGFNEVFELEESDALTVIVEKDFKCLSELSGEDNTDVYPHPKEHH